MTVYASRPFAIRRAFLLLPVLIAVAMLCAALPLPSSGEEKESISIFLNEISEKELRTLDELREAVTAGNAPLAVRLYQQLSSEAGDKVTAASEGRFVLVRSVLESLFSKLGETGKKAFRAEYDPPALRLLERAKGGESSAALDILRIYPWSTYCPEALLLLASEEADAGRFSLSVSRLERLLNDFPDFISAHPGAIALLAASYANLSLHAPLTELRKKLAERGILSLPFQGSTLGEFVDSLAGRVTTESYAEWRYPAGDPSGSRGYSTTVAEPSLIWKAPLRPIPVAPGSMIEEPYDPILKAAHLQFNSLNVRPAIWNGRLFLTDGSFAYSRDIETGIYLSRYPVGRSTAGTQTSTVNIAQQFPLSVTIDSGKLYYLHLPGSALSYNLQTVLESYSVEGAETVFDAFTTRDTSGLPAQDAEVISSMVVTSVPLVLGGQVFVLGSVRTGMTDVYAASFDSRTGRPLWVTRLFTTSGDLSNTSSISFASYGDGSVFFSGLGAICRVAAYDGSLQWLAPYSRDSKQTPNLLYEPPIVLVDAGVVVSRVADSKFAMANDIATGRLIWKSPFIGAFIGRWQNKLYYSDGGVFSVNAIDGGITLSNLDSGAKGLSAVADGALFVPEAGALSKYDLGTGKKVASYPVLGSSDLFLGRVLPYGDRIFCITPEMVYCFGDYPALVRELDAAEEKNPQDAVTPFKRSLLLFHKGEHENALVLIRTALNRVKDGDLYGGYDLKELVSYHYADMFRQMALRFSDDPAQMLSFAESGLEVAGPMVESIRLMQLKAVALARLFRLHEAVLVCLDMVEAPESRVVAPLKEFGNWTNSMGVSAQVASSGAHLDRLLRSLLLQLKVSELLATGFETEAAEIVPVALAGDSVAATRLFGRYFFTDAAMDCARKLAGVALEKRSSAYIPALRRIRELFPVTDYPEISVALTVLTEGSASILRDEILRDLAADFPTNYITIDGKAVTIKEFVQQLVKAPEKPVVERRPVPDGYIRAWTIEERTERFSSSGLRAVSTPNGIVTASPTSLSLWCVSPVDGSILWQETPPDKSFIGVTLSDSASPPGSLVVTVLAGYPAEQAGVLPGDVIVEFNGIPALSYVALVDAIASTPPGTLVPMKVVRQGETIQISIRPAKRDADNMIPDQIAWLSSRSNGDVVLLRRSGVALGFTVARLDSADGKPRWRRNFTRTGYPSKIMERGDLLIVQTYDYQLTRMAKAVFIDLNTGDTHEVPFTSDQYSPNLLSFIAGKLAMVSGRNDSLVIVDALTGSEDAVIRTENRNISHWGSEFRRYLFFPDEKQRTMFYDVLGRQEFAVEGVSNNNFEVHGDFTLAPSHGFSHDPTMGSIAAKVHDLSNGGKVSAVFKGITAQRPMLVHGDSVFLRHMVFQSNYRFSSVSKYRFSTGELVWRQPMAYGANTRSFVAQDQHLLLEFYPQGDNFGGVVVVDSDTGKILLLRCGETGSTQTLSVAGDNILVNQDGALICYKPVSYQDSVRLKADAEKAIAPDTEIDEDKAWVLAEDLLNAGFSELCVSICDKVLRSAGRNADSVRFEGMRGLARERIFSNPETFELKVTSTFVPDGKHLVDWEDGDFREFPAHAVANSYQKWTYPKSPDDLSARWAARASNEGLAIALEVRDDQHVSGGAATSDYVMVYVNFLDISSAMPAGSLIVTVITDEKDGSHVQVRGFGSSVGDIKALLSGFTRGEDGVSRYELLIPWKTLKASASVPWDMRGVNALRFNIAILDSDDPNANGEVKMYELAPTFFPYQYAYLTQTLFPILRVPKGVGK